MLNADGDVNKCWLKQLLNLAAALLRPEPPLSGMLLFQIMLYLNWYRCLWSTSSLASSSHGSWNIWWRYLHSPLPPNQREVDFLSGQPEAKSQFVNLCPLMHEESVSWMCPPFSLCLWWWRHTWWRWWWWWWPLAGSHHSILLPQLS